MARFRNIKTLQKFAAVLGLLRHSADLTTVADGFLVLSGPEADRPGEADLFYWDGQSEAPVTLGKLNGVPSQAKPEALLVLAEDREAYHHLVMSDGIPGGAPAEYRVPKQKR